MDYALVALIISGANFLLTWGVGFYVHITSRNKATNERISSLEEQFDRRLDGQGERIARLETNMANAPTHADLGELYKQGNATARQVSEMAGELKQLNTNLNMLLNEIARKGMT